MRVYKRESAPPGWKRRALQELFVRCNSRCGICLGKVDPGAQGDTSPTIDHIVPISCGGSQRSMGNLQLAHRLCNMRKSSAIVPPRFVARRPRKGKLTR